MKNIILTVLISVLLNGCQSEPQFVLEETAKDQFARLPGKIGITLKTSSAIWHRVLSDGNLVKAISLPPAPKEAAAIGIGWFYGATGLPEQKGYDYRGPFQVSPDKRFVAASIALSGPDVPGPTEIVIVDMYTKKTIVKVKSNDNRYVDGLAWSQNSQLVVVLTSSSRLGEGPIDLIGSAFGHPVPYMTYYLDVVGLDGKALASTKLVSDLRASWGEVVWIE